MPKASVNKRSTRQLKNKFYIKYLLREAGNDSPALSREVDRIISQLQNMLR